MNFSRDSIFKYWGICAVALLAFFTLSARADASDAEQTAPKAAVLIYNHADVPQFKGENFDAKLTRQLLDAAIEAIPENYEYVDILALAGVDDPRAADRGMLSRILLDQSVDRLILAELKPFAHQNHQALFSYKIETTGTLDVQIVNLKAPSESYRHEFVEKAAKDNPISYNQVIPLVMEKLTDDFKKAANEALRKESLDAPDADGPAAYFLQL